MIQTVNKIKELVDSTSNNGMYTIEYLKKNYQLLNKLKREFSAWEKTYPDQMLIEAFKLKMKHYEYTLKLIEGRLDGRARQK